MGKLSKTRRAEVIEKLERSLLNGENKSYRTYSKELNVRKETVGELIKEIISKTPRKSLEEVEFRIEYMFDKIISNAERMLDNAESFEEEEKATKLILLCYDKFQDFLERFGIKQKVADKHEIVGEVNYNINYNQKREFISNLDKQLEGIADEKKRQEIVINLLEDQENETTN